jgi:hypothetical protein
MVFFRKLRTIVPPNKTTDIYDVINELWITGKQPTPRHLQQPKYIVSFIHVIHRKHTFSIKVVIQNPLSSLNFINIKFSLQDAIGEEIRIN